MNAAMGWHERGNQQREAGSNRQTAEGGRQEAGGRTQNSELRDMRQKLIQIGGLAVSVLYGRDRLAVCDGAAQLQRSRYRSPGLSDEKGSPWYSEIRMNADELKGIVQSNPSIMGGTPVFAGTRVPLQNLVDFLEGGESVDDFLEAFPTVKREQAIAVIEAGKLKILETV